MDVVSFPEADEHYRVLFDPYGRFGLFEVSPDEAETKLARIEDKSHVTGGQIQLNLHDGRNVLVDSDEYSTGDVLRISLPDQEIADHYPRDEGAPVYVTGGTHIGQTATLQGHRTVRASAPNLIRLENETEFQTIEDYVFVIGEDEPTIELPEVGSRA